MVLSTLYNILKWMHTKATQVGALILSEKPHKKTSENTEKNQTKEETAVKDKNKNFASGSIDTSTLEKELEELESLLTSHTDVEKGTGVKISDEVALSDVETVLQKILDTEWGEEEIAEISTPIYMLELNKESEMFYSVNQRTFIPVRNHVEVIPVKNPFDNDDKSYFYVINNEIFDIDDEKVICVGWN